MAAPYVPADRPIRLADHLYAGVPYGFATSVAMWSVAYLTHMPAVRLEGLPTAILLALAQVAGCAFAVAERPPGGGRLSSLRFGLITAAVSTAVNMLILGSVVASDDGSGVARGGGLILGGALAIATAAGALGTVLGCLIRPAARGVSRGNVRARSRGVFGVVAAVAAVPVLISGGLVTSFNAGLAVPDWPGSFGANMFLFPLSKMTGGIFYEHAHRLFGSLVGLTTLSLLIHVLLGKTSTKIRLATLGVLLLVITQGVLGGIRVTSADAGEIAWRDASPNPAAVDPAAVSNNFALTVDSVGSLALALKHGVLGQATFAALCVLACALAGGLGASLARARPTSRVRGIAAWLLVGALAVQLLLGASGRHLGDSDAGAGTMLVMMHAGFAFVVLCLCVIVAARAARQSMPGSTRALGATLAGVVVVQIVLGMLAIFAVLPYSDPQPTGELEALLATVHHGTGALLLGLASVIAAQMWRLREAVQPAEHSVRAGAPITSSPQTV